MAKARRSSGQDTETRDALLDAAERLMLDEGYAAVASRRVSSEAGVNAGLVYYYFGTMDELFIAVFRRRAQWMYDQQAIALASDQPLWALWSLIHDQPNTALNFEFLALGNHRKAIKAEVAEYSRRYRVQQLDALTGALEGYGLDPERWPPVSIVIFMSGISRFLVMEESYDLDMGHAETIALIERLIEDVEGPRRAPAPAGDPNRAGGTR